MEGVRYKQASDRNLSDDPGLSAKYLRVNEANETVMQLNREEPLSDEATRTVLETTFKDLGLPAPANAPTEFDWGFASC